MSFPDIIFGTCQGCGASGGDDPDASGADAIARDTAGNGVVLKEYDGRFLCDLCIKRLKADEESLLAAERHAEEERFRRSAGFINSV